MSLDLIMSIDQMLKYREILQTKVDFARKSGKQQLLNATLSRVDAIDMVLDAALIATLTQVEPQITQLIDAKMFDRQVLSLVIGENRVKELPHQGVINFSAAEDVDSETVVPADDELLSRLREILKRNFVSNIPEAVEFYKKHTGLTMPNYKAWIKIKEMLVDNNLIGMWDKHLCNTLITNGPVVAFVKIKKHFKDWDDADIAFILNDAVERSSKMQPTPEEARQIRERAIGIFEDSVNNVREFVHDRISIDAIQSIEDISDKTHLGRRFRQIFELTAPSHRAKILTRKEYIEKGY